MAGTRISCLFLLAFMWINIAQHSSGALTSELQKKIDNANQDGPYLGLVIPNTFEMDPLLQSPSFISSNNTIEFSGKRFRFGVICHQPVILVMTGLSMINAAVTTQLLLSLFKVEGVVHYGTAGNVNPSLNVGDVLISQ